MGRKPIHKKPMTPDQRQKGYRLRNQRIAKGSKQARTAASAHGRDGQAH
jgi:hypothetical protein